MFVRMSSVFIVGFLISCPCFAEVLVKEFSITSERKVIVEINEGEKTSTLTITDTQGPASAAYFNKWSASRVIMGESAEDVTRSYWNVDPTAGQYEKRNGDDVLMDPPPLGKPFQLTLGTESPEGWEYLSFLTQEAAAVVHPLIEGFLKKHWDVLLLQKAVAKKDASQNRKSELLRKRSRNLQTYMDQFEDRNSPYEKKQTRIREGYAELVLSGRLPSQLVLQPYFDRSLNNTTLLLVHPGWEGCYTQNAMNELIERVKELDLPVVGLFRQNNELQSPEEQISAEKGIPLKDRSLEAAIFSRLGEHCVRVAAKNIIVVGANWGECHNQAMVDAIKGHFNESNEPFVIHLPAQSIAGGLPKPYKGLDQLLSEKPDQFYEEGIKKLLFKAGGKVFGDPGYSQGRALSSSEYTFKVFINGKEFPALGSGKRTVELKVWDQNKFLKETLPGLGKSP